MADDWNLTQAWAWIRWRDPAKVAAFAAETHLGLAEAILNRDGTAVVEEDHRHALLAALQDGRLAVRGLPVDTTATDTRAAGGADAMAAPAADWQALVPVAPSQARHVTGRRVAWRGLRFGAAEMQRLWPAPPRATAGISVQA